MVIKNYQPIDILRLVASESSNDFLLILVCFYYVLTKEVKEK